MAKNWEYEAGRIWPVLTELATNREVRTYSDLAPLIGTNPLSVHRALGPIYFFCKERQLPPLTGLVVARATGIPGSGFSADPYETLEAAHEAVFDYPWASVLNPFGAFGPEDTIDGLATQIVEDPTSFEEVFRLVRDRGIGQRVFRSALLLAYESECAFCGLSFEEALEAAHIAAWGDCSPAERMDVRNGLLLCSTHHKLFDSSLMGLTNEGRIWFVDSECEHGPYSKSDRAMSAKLHGAKARLPEDQALWPASDFLNRRQNSERAIAEE